VLQCCSVVSYETPSDECRELQCVLKSVAECCSVCCGGLQSVAVCVAECCKVLQGCQMLPMGCIVDEFMCVT